MMKLRISSKIMIRVYMLVAVLLLVAGGETARAADAPLEARLTFEKASFNLDDPADNLGAVITLLNASGEPVLTQGGFSELGYHLFLYFLGPEPYDKLITSTELSGGSGESPTVPPARVVAEWLPYDWLQNMQIDELRSFYPLTRPGRYKVWLKMTFVQYDPNKAEPFDTEADGLVDGYKVPYNAVIWSEPLESAPVYITLTTDTSGIRSDIRVEATEFAFNVEDKKGVTKRPLDIEVRLYKKTAIEDAGIIPSPINQKDFGDIVTNSNIRGYLLADATQTPGEYIFKNIVKDDYLVIGYAARVTDYKHLGSIVRSGDKNWGVGEIFVSLMLQTGKEKDKDEKNKEK